MASLSNATPFLFRNKKPILSSRGKTFDISSPVTEGIAILNVEKNNEFQLQSANDIFLKYINIAKRKPIGRKISEINWNDGENENQLQIHLTKALKAKGPLAFIWQLKINEIFHSIVCKIIPLNNKQGEIKQITITTSDYNDIENLEIEVERQTYFDELTGLPNRFKLFELFEKKYKPNPSFKMKPHNDEDSEAAVLFINIKKLQRINESYGYDCGDDVLCAVALQIKSTIHKNAFLTRFSNDKFVVFLSGEYFDNVKQEASRLAQSIHHNFSTKTLIPNKDIHISLSIGIASGLANIDSVEQLMQDAHLALKKINGLDGEQTIVFNPELKTQTATKLRFEKEFRDALDASALELQYQPIIDLQNGLICGFEALARWNNSKRGAISPLEFIALAEEAGLIIQLGEWALNHSCQQLKTWIDNDLLAENLFMAVNISSTHIINGNITALARDALAKSGLEGKHLKLELTESTIMENSDIARNILLDLKTLGLSIAVDDFGTGYSSLSYLSRIPADTLKIDRSFINRIENVTEGYNIIKVIINLAKSLGMTVVAEGIETNRQFKKLKELGCHYGQGYLFSKPINADKVPAFIKKKSLSYLSE